MTILGIFCLATFIFGGFCGKKLALKGITSENALQKYQTYLNIFLGTIALVLGILIIIDKLNLTPLLPKLFPSILLLYLGAYYLKIIFVAGFFFLGLLITLEITGKLSPQKIRQLMIGIGAISLALSLLFYLLKPVTNILGEPVIIDGVIIQTTNYTCAPAAIATLGRYTKTQPNLTEKAVSEITQTNRLGTTALVEIKAMEKLGLTPQYEHNLTLDDLIAINKPALLHVKEKSRNNGVRFSHAVALLAIASEKPKFFIGNPYYGLQAKNISDMKGYWFGEAIIVNNVSSITSLNPFPQ